MKLKPQENLGYKVWLIFISLLVGALCFKAVAIEEAKKTKTTYKSQSCAPAKKVEKEVTEWHLKDGYLLMGIVEWVTGSLLYPIIASYVIRFCNSIKKTNNCEFKYVD